MRLRSAAVIAAVLIAAAVACGKSEAEQQAACQKALNSSSTETSRPDACEDLSQEDYDTLLMSWAMNNAIDGMSQDDRDLLDHSDDGELNGSIGNG